ncbi:hypothetical protein D3C85_1683640 [compost metagenome]
MGQRFDALGVDGLKPFYQVENAVKLRLRKCALVGGQFDPGQPGNAGHICVIKRHRDCKIDKRRPKGGTGQYARAKPVTKLE